MAFYAFYRQTLMFLRDKLEEIGVRKLSPLLNTNAPMPSLAEEHHLDLDDAYLLVRSIEALDSSSQESWDENAEAAHVWLQLAERTMLRLGAISDEDKVTLRFLHEADIRPAPPVGGVSYSRVPTPWEDRVDQLKEQWRALRGAFVDLKNKVVRRAQELRPVICAGWERLVLAFNVAISVATTIATALVAVLSALLVALTFVVDVLRGARSLWKAVRTLVVWAFRRLHRAGQLKLRFAVLVIGIGLLLGGYAMASISKEVFRLEAPPPLEIPDRKTEEPSTAQATEGKPVSEVVTIVKEDEHDEPDEPSKIVSTLAWRDVGSEEKLRAIELLVSDPRVAHISRHIQLRRDGSYKHDGIDIATSSRRLLATVPEDCKVLWAGRRGTFGNVVMVGFVDGTQGIFGHLARIDVRVGQDLFRGDSVGVIGRTGRHHGRGYHLHFGLYDNTQNGKVMFSSNNPDEFFGSLRNDRAGVDPWTWLAVRWQQQEPNRVLMANRGGTREVQGL